MLDFSNKHLKVYLWCYFVDKVSDINMLSLILILIAFSIKFQCQYFYYNLTVSVATKEYSAPFYLPKIFFGKTWIFLSLAYLIKQFIENFISGTRREWLYLCVCKTYFYNAKKSEKCTVLISLTKNSNTSIMSLSFPWRKLIKRYNEKQIQTLSLLIYM